ncbi:Radical SAM domain protein [Staphylothermus marinus F1]|uniref:Radical SAM domain protein n=1 Tax=Staphylothermus marinus (strain ATCC 43588 / DSM 3639 / JCM 9404 / F1) TaxID=399550 RepID=A3DLK9_STAMF|nr:radical SAM protein [Staphylothermus marinus]ABN69519.1 Radical SAM domain protein [Staphylothermus marinus F1]
MGKCRICGRENILVSDTIGVCVDCLRKYPEKALPIALEAHRRSRYRFGLPPVTPTDHGGIKCSICGRGCIIGNSKRGYCGVRLNKDNQLVNITGSPWIATGLYYYDPHPTNCVAYPVCPAVTGRGYPKYALSPKGERGYYNIAVFYGACNMDCLYCQNWEYRKMASQGKPFLSIEDLVNSVNEKTTCVCFFGGDPGPWSIHAIEASRRMIEKARRIGNKVFRICWETNGLWNPYILRKAVEISLETGGIVKIDFKAWSPEVYIALTGIEPEHVELIRKNIKLVAEYFDQRPDPPLLVVSTLLVPGYIDDYEIDNMTRYIAEINNEIPYVFLGFHPDYELIDLPRTSWKHALRAVEIARRNGLRRVYVENQWLLSNQY